MITLDVCGFASWMFVGVMAGVILSMLGFYAYIEFTTKKD